MAREKLEELVEELMRILQFRPALTFVLRRTLRELDRREAPEDKAKAEVFNLNGCG